MYRPIEVRTRLGISPTTLRRWCTELEAFLSPSATSVTTEKGGSGQRRFTDEDLALMSAVKQHLDGGATMETVRQRLERGEIRPEDVDVVVLDDNPRRATAGSRSPTVDSLARTTPTDDRAAALITLLMQVAEGQEATAEALREIAETQRALLAELQKPPEPSPAPQPGWRAWLGRLLGGSD